MSANEVRNKAMISPSDQPVDQHRKLALSFGAVLLLFMLAVFSVAGYLFTQLYEKEEDRLASMLAIIFADSVGKVSFSGKYHARLFVEEIQGQIPALAFISVEEKDGKVLAHSEPAHNDTFLRDQQQSELRQQSLAADAVLAVERHLDGQVIKEVVLPYRSGWDRQVMGVVRIGIRMEEVQREKQATIARGISLILLLTVLAMVGILLLSRYFGGAHQALAAQLQGILAHSPLPISIINKSGQLLSCSKEAEQLFDCQAEGQELTEQMAGKLRSEDIRNMLDSNATIFANGKPLQLEREVELQGERRVWQVSKFVIDHDAQQQPRQVCTFVTDITAIKQAEAERLSRLRFLKVMDSVNRAIQEHSDLEQMMGSVLEVVLETFDCDRAFLMYPCQPDASVNSTVVERTKPDYPGAAAQHAAIAPDPQLDRATELLVKTKGPLTFGPGCTYGLPAKVA